MHGPQNVKYVLIISLSYLTREKCWRKITSEPKFPSLKRNGVKTLATAIHQKYLPAQQEQVRITIHISHLFFYALHIKEIDSNN